jgi:hypothetical protein
MFVLPLSDQADQMPRAGSNGQGPGQALWEAIFQVTTGSVPPPAGIRGIKEILLVYTDVGLTDEAEVGWDKVLPKITVIPPGKRISVHTSSSDLRERSQPIQFRYEYTPRKLGIPVRPIHDFIVVPDLMAHIVDPPDDSFLEYMAIDPEVVCAMHSEGMFLASHRQCIFRSAIDVVAHDKKGRFLFAGPEKIPQGKNAPTCFFDRGEQLYIGGEAEIVVHLGPTCGWINKL